MARVQQTLASQRSFEKHGRKSKREQFLDHMEQVVPWSELLALVEPHYPKAGNGRQPVGVAIMLRTYFLQQWFSLSDPCMEEAFYESPVLCRFAGVDLRVAAAPDETTILRFRCLLEQHDLGGQMLDNCARKGEAMLAYSERATQLACDSLVAVQVLMGAPDDVELIPLKPRAADASEFSAKVRSKSVRD